MARWTSPKRRTEKPQGLQQFNSAVDPSVYGSSGVLPVDCSRTQSCASPWDIARPLEDLDPNEGEEYALLYPVPGTEESRCHSNPSALAELNRPQPAVPLQILNDDDNAEDKEELTSLSSSEETCYESFAVDDEERRTKFLDDALSLCQTTNLKKILKAWLRQLYPKKQSKYPYNGGEMRQRAIRQFGDNNMAGHYTKPADWPEGVLHLAPDRQPSQGNINLAKGILKNPRGKNGEEVSRILDDVYNVMAKMERFERGEIDGDTAVQVRQISNPPPKRRRAKKRAKKTPGQVAAIPRKPVVKKKRSRAPSTPSSSDEPLPMPNSNLGTETATSEPSATEHDQRAQSILSQSQPQPETEWEEILADGCFHFEQGVLLDDFPWSEIGTNNNPEEQ
ncbi:hypothetical protein MMC07_008280 [Pseudocyphellaria aurata]|nr:hypothetical protein [Pseudocyphellaria aurata]